MFELKYTLHFKNYIKSHKFLKIFRRTTSWSGYHRTTWFRSTLKSYFYFKLIKTNFKNSGHTKSGIFTVHTKGKHSKSKNIYSIKTLTFLKYFIFCIWFVFKPKTKKSYMLCVTSNNAICYLPQTNRCKPLMLLGGAWDGLCKFFFNYRFKKYMILCDYLGHLKFSTGVCFIMAGISEQCSIARACGSVGIVLLRRKHINYNFVIIRLPSGILKMFIKYVVVLLGYVLPRKKRLIKNTKAGYWRNLGKKPQVRGIVKNSVDHPNGGRARSIRKHKSPWGKLSK